MQTDILGSNVTMAPAAQAEAPISNATETEFWEEALLRSAERKNTDELADIYDTMRKRGEEELKQWKKMLDDIAAARKKSKMNTRPPQISLRGMTQRLVSAASAADARAVLGEAGQAISALQLALSGLEGKQRQQVQAMIQSAQKLAGRCGQKINELSQEDHIRARQKKAEKTGNRKNIEIIKQELRQQEINRAHREQSYLLEHFPSVVLQNGLHRTGPVHPAQRLDAAAEAKIEAMAEAIAITSTEVAFAGTGAVILEGGMETPTAVAITEAPATADVATFVQMA